jgi:hypothetical protein
LLGQVAAPNMQGSWPRRVVDARAHHRAQHTLADPSRPRPKTNSSSGKRLASNSAAVVSHLGPPALSGPKQQSRGALNPKSLPRWHALFVDLRCNLLGW